MVRKHFAAKLTPAAGKRAGNAILVLISVWSLAGGAAAGNRWQALLAFAKRREPLRARFCDQRLKPHAHQRRFLRDAGALNHWPAATAPVTASTPFFKTSSAAWQAYAGGAVPAYLSGVTRSQIDSIAIDILANTDLSRLSGAMFAVGYGTSVEEMIAAGRFRIMYQVP